MNKMIIKDKCKTPAQKSREQFESLEYGTVFRAYSVQERQMNLYMKIKGDSFKGKFTRFEPEVVCLNQNFRLAHLRSNIDYKIEVVESTLTVE